MRSPALATSLAVHAIVLTTVILVPILEDDPMAPSTASPAPSLWPSPRVALADVRPAAVPSRRRMPRRPVDAPGAPVAPELAVTRTPVESADLDPTSLPQEDSGLVDAAGAGEACCALGDETGHESGDPEGDGSGAGRGTGPVRVGGLVVPPTKIRHVDPAYPEIARAARISGQVVLDCLLDVEGRVTEIRVVSGHPLLDAAAKDAVARWRYTPTYLNGTGVPVLLTVTIRFKFRG